VRRVLTYGLLALCSLLPITAQTLADRHAGWMLVDFRAYYCGALMLRQDQDPYRVDPLHACEHSTPSPFYMAPDRVTVPAPYPPYALALLAPLTFLSFRIAAVVWWLLLAACFGVAAWSLSRLIAARFTVGCAAFALSLGLTCFSSGNAIPIAVALITLAALLLQRGRSMEAAACVSIAMIEPNVALPAAIGLFVVIPKARVPLIVAAALLGALSIFSGPRLNAEYLLSVLPAHALSEVSRDNQYSLSTILAAAGVSDRASAQIGALSYLVMLALGVVAGRRLAQRYTDGAFALVIPTAFALIGGSFVHTEALAAAVPAAMMLFARETRRRALLMATSILLTVPWIFATSAALFLAPIVPVAYLVRELWSAKRTTLGVAGLATAAIIVLLFDFSSGQVHHATPSATHNQAFIDPTLAEASWRIFVLSDSTNRLSMWLLRAPSWIGLLLVFGAALAQSLPTLRLGSASQIKSNRS
jgi:hypothetical protein